LQKAQQDQKAREEERAAELAPLQKLKLLADIAATNRSNAGGTSVSLQPIELNGQMYNYNPKTGEYTKANITGGKSKYNEQDIVDFANAVAEGRAKLTGVPSEIRGQVDQVVQQLEAAKPWYKQPWLGLGSLFQ